ncbi:hypothetical protein F511_45746 [Dorcoceras hygrometricum]|uniref:Uncharacterized protein n=1 Tax=Dorcoceras hygrometricum TaxID=472368 RepID=A0A2Z6ZVQ8_9LAMI|nr:hypothetical protein F511_45746 [Dorcoceras hygrometricum]
MARWWPLRTAAASAGRVPLRAGRAALAETLRDGCPVVVRYVAHGCATGCRNHWSDVDARWAGRARCRRKFCGGGGRPPLRRVSGDVVTAGLITSRVWFGPVPGSP